MQVEESTYLGHKLWSHFSPSCSGYVLNGCMGQARCWALGLGLSSAPD